MKEAVLLEVASGASLGLFKIGGRTFRAVPLKVREGKLINAIYRDGAGLPRYPDDAEFTPVLAEVLSSRSQDDDPVDAEWLEEVATGDDYAKLLSLLQNPATYEARVAAREAEAAKNPEKDVDTKNAPS